MAIRTPIDALDEWFKPTSDKVRVVRKKKGSTLKSIGKSKPVAGALSGLETAKRVARKTPQVMVKITSTSKGMCQTKNHLDYISRHSQLELTDQDGRVITNRQGVKDLKDEWRDYGVPEESTKRECFNIIFGMPDGTSLVGLKNAVAKFAEEEFAGHKYVMALHESSTDEKTKNPHVHLCVVATDAEGRRLNPRKNDLRRWREDFAIKLREQGVDAVATTRRQHLKRRFPEKFKTRKKWEREASTQKKSRKPRKYKGRPDYGNANIGATRTTQRAAALYQSRIAKTEIESASKPVTSLRNLSGLDMVSGQVDKRGRQMLLHSDARNHLGWEGKPGNGVRRAGTGAAGAGSRAGRLKQFEKQLQVGAATLIDAAKAIKKNDPTSADQVKRYAENRVSNRGRDR